MLYNQVVLGFLGEELVIVLMYTFWLMLGLVLFKNFKEFYEFLKAIVLGIWFGIRWTGLKVWFAIRWLGKYLGYAVLLIFQAIQWLFGWIQKGLQWIWKMLVKAWRWMVRLLKVIGNYLWKGLIMIGNFLKASVQWTWWILAGVGIAIFETLFIIFTTIAQALFLGLKLLAIGLKWLVYPFFVLHQWLVSIQKGQKIAFVFKPWWVQTMKWFQLQWRSLIFKPKNSQKVSNKITQKKPLTSVATVAADDQVTITSLNEVTQANVEKVKAAFAREEALDDVAANKEAKAFENRQIYAQPIQSQPAFFDRLSPKLKDEFRNLFTTVQPNRVIQEVTYEVGGKNDAFFTKLFNFLYRIRKVISLDLLQALIEEGVRLAGEDARTKTNVYEAGIRVAYARRSNASFLAYAKKLAQIDVNLHVNVLRSQHQYVYSVKRLAIILEKQEAFAEAISLVEQAIQLKFHDQTEGEYPARFKRLQAQRLIANAKQQGLYVEKTATPIVETNEVLEEEADEEKTIDLSTIEIKETNFYLSLNATLKAEFDRYFVVEGEGHLVKSLVFIPGEKNANFYQNVFNSLYAYRKVISFDLLMAIYEEIKGQLEGKPQLLSSINEATIRILFYRRKDAIFLEACEALCQEDIALHLEVLKTRKGFVYSFKRLAILFEKQGLYDDAIAMCDRALTLNLDDKTQGGYAGRKARILKRQIAQDKVGA